MALVGDCEREHNQVVPAQLVRNGLGERSFTADSWLSGETWETFDCQHLALSPFAGSRAVARSIPGTTKVVLDVVPITATISMLRFHVVNAYAVRLD